ncbi:Stk1 family PASTA domain-containing Ser/Thr kinase [Streptomyces sp. RB6PN25]|uniref:non-specific serine/threonine protein kinase n=1 Tax=Streptomyces humicola TaxID=2953240 RepID=A0ABT1PXJ4_9ACTN|nr:Stk1 family PASTA domain-containing Ser/Thr kinase [Streptomyces humicola]MCQ4081715.1 Stk1 family PASTA domain-containing Ser/Thr kinase [Streptomyces humicola]
MTLEQVAERGRRIVGGRYAVREELGRGGMAEVHLADDLRLDRTVAVKTLRPELAGDPTYRARFLREAQSVASLNHPGIVAVYDTGEDGEPGFGLPYIVMEYVEGRTLLDLVRSGPRPTPRQALELTAGVLDALGHAHRSGIVHRDIKPANVMVTADGTVKVMDFGIARPLGVSGATLTQTSMVIGTAEYLSPEQARGQTVDARSDLYSTGCLLYELLTGGSPFTDDTPLAVAYKHLGEEPEPPSARASGLTSACDSVVLTALTKDRDRRYGSAEEMRAAVEQALRALDAPETQASPVHEREVHEREVHEREVHEREETAGAETETETARIAEAPRRTSRRLWPVVAVLAGILAVVGAGAYIATAPGTAFGSGFGSGFGSRSATVQVPDLAGKTVVQARTAAFAAGLHVVRAGMGDCAATGTGLVRRVCAQIPVSGSRLARGSTIRLLLTP